MNKIVFSLCTASLLLAKAAAANPKGDDIGKAIATRGKVFAEQVEERRKLTRGKHILTKDTIVTEARSSIKARFVDGTLMSLKPNSSLQINQYIFNKKDGKKNVLKVNLLKGGFKSLTGLINKSNPNATQVDCNVAVIGVRGTWYEVNASPNSGVCGAAVLFGAIDVTDKRTRRRLALKGGQAKNAVFVTKKGIEVTTYKDFKERTKPACN